MSERRRSGDGRVLFGEPPRAAPETPGFGRAGALTGLLLVAAMLGGFTWAAVSASVPPAEHPRLFGGSLVLEDQRPLTVIDLATGQVTIRLQGVYTDVGATGYGEVEAVALRNGTLLLDRQTGTFNLLAKDDFLVDTAGPGVGLGSLAGSAGAFADGDRAYIVRYASHSTVSLVDTSTVREGALLESHSARAAGRTQQAVTPRGFTQLTGPIGDLPGSAAVDGDTGDLWVLVGSGNGCDIVQIHPLASAAQGLVASTRASFPGSCARAAITTGSGVVGVARPGTLRLFDSRGSGGGGHAVKLAGTAAASRFIPVTGGSSGIRFLARAPAGWYLVTVATPSGRQIRRPLGLLPVGAAPAAPVMSAGSIYTLDQAAQGQPTLWQINASTGSMSPVPGQPTYPARGPTEKARFDGAQVLAVGPRVVFNNPGSLLAVVVFTDGSRAPLVVDKSEAVTVSATGPADLGVSAVPQPPGSQQSVRVPSKAVPAVQPVSQQVTCATTTQKPYAPQINSVTASSGSALVSWSYQLLDQTDCEPDSWSVKVTALSSPHQPDNPVQVVNGQSQLTFNGLRPATTYEVTVTAYINNQSTTSSPVTFTTAARGPDAPSSVTTTSDGKGDWVVSWTPCTAADCYVPADTWNVTGTACGPYYVGQPPTVQVPGTQTSATIDADTLGLLGDSLSFSVQGALASGLTGNPTSDSSCTQAWRPPDPSVISLERSAAQTGQTVTVTLQVAESVSPVEAFGSRSTEFVYTVAGTTVGPTSATTATVQGVAPGVPYTPSVVIYPTGHPDATATVTGAPLTPTLRWPPDMSVTVQPSVDQSNPNQGTLALTFSNVPTGSMQARGTYTCGSTQGPTFSGPLTSGVLQVTMDLIDFGGRCTVSAVVSDTDPAPYGGTSSAPMTAGFTIGTQPQYSFSSQVDPSCQNSLCTPEKIDISYSGSEPATSGGDWVIKTQSSRSGSQAGSDPCASQDQLSGTDPFVQQPTQIVTLPDLCLDPRKVDVTVLFTYLGTVTTVDAGTPSGSPAPPPTTTTTTTTSTTAGAATPALGANVRTGTGLSAMIVPVLLPLAGLARRIFNRKKTRAAG